jgi:hypothetical protein
VSWVGRPRRRARRRRRTPPPPDPAESGAPRAPSGCTDPDPQVVATCLAPVGAIAVLPDGRVRAGRRAHHRPGVAGAGRVRRRRSSRRSRSTPTGGGGLTGLVLFARVRRRPATSRLHHQPTDNRVVKLAPASRPSPCSSASRGRGAQRGARSGVDADGPAARRHRRHGPRHGRARLARGQGAAHRHAGAAGRDQPGPRSPVLSVGCEQPGGPVRRTTPPRWPGCPTAPTTADTLHLVTPGPLPVPAWRWPDRPGVAGCTAHDGVVTIAQTYGTATYVLRGDRNGLFSGQPQNAASRACTAGSGPRARPGRLPVARHGQQAGRQARLQRRPGDPHSGRRRRRRRPAPPGTRPVCGHSQRCSAWAQRLGARGWLGAVSALPAA